MNCDPHTLGCGNIISIRPERSCNFEINRDCARYLKPCHIWSDDLSDNSSVGIPNHFVTSFEILLLVIEHWNIFVGNTIFTMVASLVSLVIPCDTPKKFLFIHARFKKGILMVIKLKLRHFYDPKMKYGPSKV